MRELPPLEDGFPIPPRQAPPNRPRKKAQRKQPPWQALMEKATHGQSVLVPISKLTTVKGNAKQVAVRLRWKDAGYRCVPGIPGRFVRVWFLKK